MEFSQNFFTVNLKNQKPNVGSPKFVKIGVLNFQMSNQHVSATGESKNTFFLPDNLCNILFSFFPLQSPSSLWIVGVVDHCGFDQDG